MTYQLCQPVGTCKRNETLKETKPLSVKGRWALSQSLATFTVKLYFLRRGRLSHTRKISTFELHWSHHSLWIHSWSQSQNSCGVFTKTSNFVEWWRVSNELKFTLHYRPSPSKRPTAITLYNQKHVQSYLTVTAQSFSSDINSVWSKSCSFPHVSVV